MLLVKIVSLVLMEDIKFLFVVCGVLFRNKFEIKMEFWTVFIEYKGLASITEKLEAGYLWVCLI